MEYDFNRISLSDIRDVHHGGPDVQELVRKGLSPGKLLDFSVSINPFPIPRPVRRAINKSRISAYPDPRSTGLTAAIAGHHKLSTDGIVPVNGLSQGIWLLSCLLNSPGRGALIAGPCYGEYEKYSRVSGANIIEVRSREEDNFRPDSERLCRIIREKGPAITWICNPNNPTGVLLEREELLEIGRVCGESRGYLIVDEAYINFTESRQQPLASAENIITLRSMTKDFSLPGLRLGYIISDKKISAPLRKLQPIWSINAAAQAAGTAALNKLPIYEKQWENLRKAKADFIRELEEFDLRIFPGKANFILLKHGRPSAEERGFIRDKLLDSGILIRDCSSFGLPEYFRLGVSTPEKNRKIVKIFRRLGLWEK